MNKTKLRVSRVCLQGHLVLFLNLSICFLVFNLLNWFRVSFVGYLPVRFWMPANRINFVSCRIVHNTVNSDSCHLRSCSDFLTNATMSTVKCNKRQQNAAVNSSVMQNGQNNHGTKRNCNNHPVRSGSAKPIHAHFSAVGFDRVSRSDWSSFWCTIRVHTVGLDVQDYKSLFAAVIRFLPPWSTYRKRHTHSWQTIFWPAHMNSSASWANKELS